jgi:hypothetical protein
MGDSVVHGSWFMDMTREVHRTCIRIRIRISMTNSILELCRTFVEGLHCFSLLAACSLLHSVFTNSFAVIVDMNRTCINVWMELLVVQSQQPELSSFALVKAQPATWLLLTVDEV